MSNGEKVIDVHAHVTLEKFRRAVMQNDDWYGMTPQDGELDNPKNHWGVQRRLEAMDEMGVDVQMVSPTACFYQYHREPDVAARIAAEANDELADMMRAYPQRFGGLATLPMQDVSLAIAELHRSVTQLGLHGIMVDDHVNGLTYDNAIFDPLWEAVAELDAFVLIHQNMRTTVAYRTRDYFLPNSIGNLTDRAITFGTFIYGGVMDKYPGLKICLGHAGGYTPYAVDRLDKGWEAWPQLRGKTQGPPSTYLRRFYYDTVTYKPRTLRFLADVVGADRVVFGTDFPAPMVVEDSVHWIDTMPELTSEERHAMLRGNTNALFSIG